MALSREPFWKGFNDGRSGADYLNHWTSQTARFEYWEGYLGGERRTRLAADGSEYKCQIDDCIGLKTRRRDAGCPKCLETKLNVSELNITTNEHVARRFPDFHAARDWAAENVKGWTSWRIKDVSWGQAIIELRPGEVFVAQDTPTAAELDPPVCDRCEERTADCECTEEQLEQHECFENGHCGCRDCHHKGFCCSCGGEIDNEPCGQYDTLAEKELDEAIDRYNDSRQA